MTSRLMRVLATVGVALGGLALACTDTAELPPATGSRTATAAPATLTAPPTSPPEVRFVENGEAWTRALASTSFDTAGPLMALAENGDLVVGINIGTDVASANFGGSRIEGLGENDFVVGRFDATGRHLWSRHFGGPQNEALYALEVAADGSIWLGGGFENALDLGTGELGALDDRSGFVARLDRGGVGIEARVLGASVTAIAALAGGGAIVAGGFGDPPTPESTLEAHGERDMFAARVDDALDVGWVASFGSDGWDSAKTIALAGDSVVVAAWLGLDRGDGALNVGLVSFDLDGRERWSHTFVADGWQEVSALVATPDGVVIGGTFSAPFSLGGNTLERNDWDRGNLPQWVPQWADLYLAAFDAAGTHVWSRRYGSSGADSLDDLVATPDGELLAVGTLGGTLEFDGLEPLRSAAPGAHADPPETPRPQYRGYLARFDASGEPLGARALMLSSTNVWGWRLGAGDRGRLVLGGRFFYSLEVEGIGHLSTGQWGDAFLATIDAP